MKKRILTAICLVGSGLLTAQAQELGYSIGGHVPSQAAVLDVNAKNKGVLIPRIALESTTLLNGNKNPEGVIVYNTGTATENTGLKAGFYYWSGSKWEQVVGNTLLSEQITNIDNKFTTEIKNITNIIGEPGEGGKTDISYLVSYNPDNHVFTYLLPKTEGGYDKKEIDFETATKEAETNTFMREISTGEGAEKVISAYIYFSERAITDWLKDNKNGDPVKDMPAELGTKVDVLGVVNNNFKEIFENNTNTEIINEIIKQSPDNVWVEERDVNGNKEMFLVYNDKVNGTQVVPLTQNETQTSMFKHTVVKAGEAADETPTEILDVNGLEEGAIYYSYKGEHGKTFYINMTNDVINSIHNNTTLKEEIFNTVNNYTTEGGNVYYGPLTEGGTDNVLYIIDDKKEKQQLDISKDIIKILEETTNNIVVETILKQTEVKVSSISGQDVAVGTTIDNAKVYKGKRAIKVNNVEDGYDVTFVGKIAVSPSKKVSKEDDKDFTYEPTGEKLETLLSATIINVKNKQVVTNTVTDVEVNGNELDFYFGNNGMYVALENGDYEVVFEYTAR